MSPHVYEVSRSYVKAQTFISYIGGFITFVRTIFVSLNDFFMHFIIYEKVINKIFFYKIDNGKYNKLPLNKYETNKNNLNNSYGSNCNLDNNKNNIKYLKNNLKLNLNDNNKNVLTNDNLISENHKSIDAELIKLNNQNKSFNINNQNNEQIKKHNKTSIIRNISQPLITMNVLEKYSKKNRLKIPYSKKLVYFCVHNNQDLFYYNKAIEIVKQKLDIISIIHESFILEIIKQFYFKDKQNILLDHCFKKDLIDYRFNKTKFYISNHIDINQQITKTLNDLLIQNQNHDNDINSEINQYLINLYLT
jgi:hypothetical protein